MIESNDRDGPSSTPGELNLGRAARRFEEMTHVLRTIIWVLTITPARVLIRLFETDPPKREGCSEDATYWEEPDEQPDDIEAYFRQF